MHFNLSIKLSKYQENEFRNIGSKDFHLWSTKHLEVECYRNSALMLGLEINSYKSHCVKNIEFHLFAYTFGITYYDSNE